MKTVLFALIVTTSGCASSFNQDFQMSGSAEGIRAYNDGLYGIAKTAKESPDAHSEYAAQRVIQEQQITTRTMKRNWIAELFNGNK